MASHDPDLLPWSRFWHSDLTGPVLSLEPADRWRWAALRSYIACHGTNGVLLTSPTNPALAAIFGVEPCQVISVIKRLPNVSLGDAKDVHDRIACTWSNWYSTQVDPTQRVRRARTRAKRRSEEIRGEKIITPSVRPSPKPAAQLALTPDPEQPAHRNGYTKGFESLWAVSHAKMKVGKGAAFDVWKKFNLEPRWQEIGASMREAVKANAWRRDSNGDPCVPNLRTWLNQRWFDDGPKKGPSTWEQEVDNAEKKSRNRLLKET